MVLIGICIFAFLCLMGPAGCGYHFKGAGLGAPEGVKTIAIPMLKNKTTKPGIETVFTGDLAYEFTRSKALEVVKNETADAVLIGSIASLRTNTVAHTADYVSDERRVTVSLSLILKRHDGKVIWTGSRLSDNEIYQVAGDRATTDDNERKAIEKISERLAEKIHTRILEDF